ncbi:MAG: amidohydrolase family protein, partial [Candidatus Marinimicrobia bacterium]|nr:amidohydrolase family protein [Candidatus Neomarinimicrobiota bacterium]
KLKGSLEPGKLADFVIINKDIINIPPEEIRDARVMMTVVDGKVVYER